MFSLETGFEVTLQGEQRLSMSTHGRGAAPGAASTPAAIAAAAATTTIVAAEVTPDNGTLAVACVGSGGGTCEACWGQGAEGGEH